MTAEREVKIVLNLAVKGAGQVAKAIEPAVEGLRKQQAALDGVREAAKGQAPPLALRLRGAPPEPPRAVAPPPAAPAPVLRPPAVPPVVPPAAGARPGPALAPTVAAAVRAPAQRVFDVLRVPPAQERAAEAHQKVQQSLRAQEQSLDAIRAQMAPGPLQERVRLALAEEEAHKRLGLLLEQEREKQTGVSAAVREAAAGLEQQEQSVKKVRELLANPALIRRQARVNIAHQEAGQQLAAKVKAEEEKIAPTVKSANPKVKAAGDVLGSLSGLFGGRLGGALGGAGKTLAGLFPGVGGALSGLAGAVPGIGTAVAAVSALTPVVKSLASAPFAAVAGGMNTVTGALKELGGPLGPVGSILGVVQGVGSGMKKMGDSLGPLGIGLSVVGGAIDGLTGAFKDFLMTAVQLAGAASPATLKRFEVAVKDTEAVVGRVFVPVAEKLTQVVRMIGDALATILPSTDEVRKALSGLDPFFRELKTTLGEVGPFLKDVFNSALQQLGAVLRVVGNALAFFQRNLRAVLQFLGVATPGAKLQSSVGAAPAPASFQSIDEVSRRVQLAAYAAGAQPQGPTKDDIPNLLDKIYQRVDRIAAWVEEKRGQVERVVEQGKGAVGTVFPDPLGIRKAILGF